MKAKSKYLFRLDDISWDMNVPNFKRIKRIFLQYGIKPVIGVIPFNEDRKLKQQSVGSISEKEFWQEIKLLQEQYQWAIALHGYNHVYTSEDAGLLGINNYSEFAGVSYEEQLKKIQNGIAIFKKNDIRIDAFMAPAHSFDENTLKALKVSGIDTVTDGLTAYPYVKNEMVFIPQVWSYYKKYSWGGVNTICFHINKWKDQQFVDLERMLKSNINGEWTSSFLDVVAETRNGRYHEFEKINPFSAKLMLMEKKVIKVAVDIKRKFK